MSYQAPVDDIMSALNSAVGLGRQLDANLYDGLDQETIRAIIEEAGKFATDILEPLNMPGDLATSKFVNGKVVTPPGWDEAYKAFAAGGWSALPGPEAYGGQGLPEIVSTSVCEIWNSANVAFGLCPLLTQGAIHALEAVGSEDLKRVYLPKMISGEWTGTMNLTEPHAGSDLGELRCKAERQGDGTYRITGTKIFITYGDHELTDNIIHLVLARLPDAPEGTRGISLFLVPKYLVGADGAIGARNDVACAGVEHKLGIHASPTCVMKFGENGGALGFLVGEENKGLAAMFIMMNQARLAVGMQGVAVAERATQRAIQYAHERRQGRATNGTGMAPIIQHADIRRSIMTMKALTQASRAICLDTAIHLDIAHKSKNAETRQAAANRAALLTPIAKAFSTDVGCEVASMGVQIHGGMGFIEETGAAQYYRDARILPIYEGTNGIQAIDLVGRKLPLEGGKVLAAYLDDLARTVADVVASNQPEFGRMGERLSRAVSALSSASKWIATALSKTPDAAFAGATPYLRLFGLTAGGVYLAREALAAVRDGGAGANERVARARVFAETQAVAAEGLRDVVMTGADGILAVAPDRLTA